MVCSLRLIAANHHPMFLRFINILTLVASLLLLAMLSVEVIYSRELADFSELYSWTMLAVCIIFSADFFALMAASHHPWHFLARNGIVLLLSIPYHTIFTFVGIALGHTATITLSSIAMLRAVMAIYITLRWLIVRRTTRLLWAYIATVMVCTYFAALFFYEYEAPVNSAVKGFGDALWWAAMNLTTVGAEIFPVTAIGKAICVMLAIVGMAMFPVFTVYVTSLFASKQPSGTRVADDTTEPKSK